MHPNSTFPHHFPSQVNPMTSSPYPNSYDTYNNPFNQSQYDTAPHAPNPYNGPPSHSFNTPQYDTSQSFQSNTFPMNASGIPGMSNIINNPNPYQSPLPPIRGSNSYQSPLPSNRGSQYNTPGPPATPFSTPPSQRGSSFSSLPPPEANQPSMPPPVLPRSHPQSTSGGSRLSTGPAAKRKRGISSGPLTNDNHSTESSDNERWSDDDFNQQVANAICSPTHSGPNTTNLIDDDDAAFDDSDPDCTEDLPAANEIDSLSLSNANSTSFSVQSPNHPDITPESMEAIAKHLQLTTDEITDLDYVYSFSNPNDREYVKLGLMAKYSRQQAITSSSLNWKSDTDICLDIRLILHKLITKVQVRSFLGHTPKNGQPELFALDNIALTQFRGISNHKDPTYKSTLPMGFNEKRPEASQAVLKTVKEIANHVRADFRKTLLTEIEPGTNNYVPDLKCLVGLVTRFRRNREDRRNDNTIWEATDEDHKCRYALLRLIAIKHKLAQGNTTPKIDPLPKSMWTWVDNRLSWFYNKLEEPEQRKYRELVISTDSKYFNGARTWEATLKAHNGAIYLPDETEWQMAN